MPKDWDTEAKDAIAYVWDQLSEAHRGGFAWHEPSDVGIIFDNRAGERVRDREIEFIRKLCELDGSEIYATAVDAGSWAVLLHCPAFDAEKLHDWAWGAMLSARAEVFPELPALTPEVFYSDGDFPMSQPDWLEYELAARTIAVQYANPNRWKNCQREMF